MRFREKLDHIMWGLAMALPLLVYLVLSINGTPTFEAVMVDFTGIQFFEGISTYMNSIGWAVPTFLWSYAVWVACVYITHLTLDVLLFVPRLGTRLASRFFKDGGEF